MMRITGGVARGRLIKVPAGRHVRPTSDRVRQAIFNILSGRIVDRPVIDLFAGAGTMGLEALSRGASSATFVESDRRVAAVLIENVTRLGFMDRAHIVRQDVFLAVPNIIVRPWTDLIFADPPYGRGLVERTVRLIAPLLGPGGCLVLEHHRLEHVNFDILPAAVRCVDQRRYGDTVISFFAAPKPEEDAL